MHGSGEAAVTQMASRCVAENNHNSQGDGLVDRRWARHYISMNSQRSAKAGPSPIQEIRGDLRLHRECLRSASTQVSPEFR